MRKMRDSGIEWVGAIPQDWQLSKIGSLYTQRNEKVSDKDYQPLSVTMQGILPQLATAAKTDDGDNRKLVRVGDFAINSRSDRRGSCGISPLDGSVSLINIILTPRTAMHPGYYNWLFHTTLFADEFYKWGHGIVADLWTTRWQEMKSISVPVPEYAEQERIAAFLDAECAEIDAVLEKTRASIEEYKKLKQAIITQAVTKVIESCDAFILAEFVNDAVDDLLDVLAQIAVLFFAVGHSQPLGECLQQILHLWIVIGAAVYLGYEFGEYLTALHLESVTVFGLLFIFAEQVLCKNILCEG